MATKDGAEYPTPAEAAASPPSILIVDDDPMQIRTARRVLARSGYRIDTLESGRKAYGRFAEAKAQALERGEERPASPYDVVIFDMLLNEQQTGLEVLDRVRELFPELRGIIVSGDEAIEEGRLTAGRGIVWLAKPYTADALTSAVRSALVMCPCAREQC
jgi:CheY-like chemotaxis protein